jgi:aminopeptidase N
VQHYRYQIELNDINDKIIGRAAIAIKLLSNGQDIALDLVQTKSNGKGMKVDSVVSNKGASFQQVKDRLIIHFAKPVPANTIDTITIVYSGVPLDGLIISKNKFGDRTFFADNWPNRAHHWIPCNDLPSDKASVEFIVSAPIHYSVISNGVLMEESNLSKTVKLTHWKEDVPIPTKVMVIGAAQFAVARVDTGYQIPIYAWVYPQDKTKGFYDYALTTSILQFLTDYIGPYAFKKLANVQSTTMFGGMENASAIFYAETSITGTRKEEHLLVHEIVHQWFGNMASEKSFPHLWLSEGFATYLTDVYWEKKYGAKAFQERLSKERDQVIQFSKVAKMPVVDSVSDLMDLLNANSYQKGAWVLHMLRKEVGDAAFHKIIQTYYQQYKGSNADTRDFQAVTEKISGKNLKTFFDQWLYLPGIPKFKLGWKWSAGKINITIDQTGGNKFSFPLSLGLIDASGKQTIQTIAVMPGTTNYSISSAAKPVNIILDPEVQLLFDGNISETK